MTAQEKKKILFVTNALYPEGDAESLRVHLFAKMILSMGYECKVISNKREDRGIWHLYETVPYMTIKLNGENALAKALGYLTYAQRLHQVLTTVEKEWHPDIILASDLKNNALIMLKQFCSKNSVTLVYDCVEWYSKEEFGGVDTKSVQQKTLQNEELIDRSVKVIAISTFLERYFKGKNIDCIRIPALIDSGAALPARKPADGRIHIAYAGNPGQKDNLGLVFAAIAKLEPSERKKLCFDLAGLDESYLASESRGIADSAKECCCFYGKVARMKALQIVRQADFTILLRPEAARYAKAGFPTKIPESLALGTPVIWNSSSDLSLYLTDGKDSIAVEEYTVNGTVQAIRKALAADENQLNRMRVSARNTAVSCFNYLNYAPALKEFLN